jgi:membrane protease YdiL (CAAX protease family)
MSKGLNSKAFFAVAMVWFVFMLTISIQGSSGEGTGNFTVNDMKILQVASVILLFILPSLLIAMLFSKEKLHYFQLDKIPSSLFIIISIILVLSATPFIGYLEGLNKAIVLPRALSGLEQWMKASEEKVKEIEDAFMKNQRLSDLLVNLFVIAFMAALSEELFFRGLIQRSMLNLTKNVHFAVWTTAILFSAFHLQFYGFLPRIVLGAILGYIYVWSGSLWTGIIVHFLNNALVLVVSYLSDHGHLSKNIEDLGMEGDKISLTWALPSVLLVAGCLFLLHKMKQPIKFPDN